MHMEGSKRNNTENKAPNREDLPGKQNQPFSLPQRHSKNTTEPQRPTPVTNRPPFVSQKPNRPKRPPMRPRTTRSTSATNRPPFPSMRPWNPRLTSATNRPPFSSTKTRKPRPTSATKRPPFPSMRTRKPRPTSATNRPPFPSQKPNWSFLPPRRPTENETSIGTQKPPPTPVIKRTLPTRKPSLPTQTKGLNFSEFMSLVKAKYRPGLSVNATVIYVARVVKYWDQQMPSKKEIKDAIIKAEINDDNLKKVLFCLFASIDIGSSNQVDKNPINSPGDGKIPRTSQTPNNGKQPWSVQSRMATSPSPFTNAGDTDAMFGEQSGEDEDTGKVSIDIGLWSAVVCEEVNDDMVCQQADYNDFMQDINAWSMTDVQVEAVFGVIFGVIGCISAVLMALPSCLKDRKRLLLVFGICGLILSGLLYLISIARAVSLNARVNEQIGREYATFKMKSPWCLIVGGIGAGLAFVTSGMLVTQKWVDKREEWSQFNDEVVFTREINQPTDVAIKSDETNQTSA